MLQNIEIRNAPAFGVPSTLQIGELSGIDVIFGPNGSGKTTISRALANPSLFGGADLKWNSDTEAFEIRIYNCDYARNNFSESGDVPGVLNRKVRTPQLFFA